ncbi:MAG: glycosyltransferase family 39 protein [Candidatus Atribacteria bacterium]|nr:glycosyltransferase family 39 protein [Candidatus Atribacteria bacterium]
MKSFIERIQNYLTIKEKYIYFFLFILTFILRTIYVIYTWENSGTEKWADDWEYLFYGKSIAAGNFYPVYSEDRPHFIVGPLIPIFIALFNLIFGDTYWPFFIYNVFVSSISIVFLFWIGKILLNKYLGAFISLWGILYIDYYKYLPHILKEPTICFLIILLIYLILKYYNKQNIYYLLLCGIVFILLIHTDERYIFLIPFLIVIPFLRVNKFVFNRNSLISVAMLVGLILLLMIPWTLRNYKAYNEIVILSPRTTAFTSKIWGTNISSLAFEGEEGQIKHKERYLENSLKQGKKYGITPRLYNKTESKIRAFVNYWQPTYFKPTYIQYGYRFQKWSLTHNLAGLLFYGIFLPFFILGAVRIFRERNIILIWLLSIPLVHSLLHAFMVWPLERYRVPVNFIIILIAIYYLIEKMIIPRKI